MGTIFECASRPNLANINKNIAWNINYFGYDISKKAIKFANIKLKENTLFFTHKLSIAILNSKLKNGHRKNLIYQFMIEFCIL